MKEMKQRHVMPAANDYVYVLYSQFIQYVPTFFAKVISWELLKVILLMTWLGFLVKSCGLKSQ